MWVCVDKCPHEGERMGEVHSQVARALAIVAAGGIELVSKGLWAVPSQSGPGVYLVSFRDGAWGCLCPRFAKNRTGCKHIDAVRLKSGDLVSPGNRNGARRQNRPTYRQNWTAYNRAQRAEAHHFDPVLADLVSGLSDPAPVASTGRPRFPFSDLVFCAVKKLFDRTALRNGHGENDLLHARGWISAVPSRNMVSAMLLRPEVTPVLTDLVAKSALPLATLERKFAADASGFRANTFGHWRREKWGDKDGVENIWLKCTVLAGVSTQIIPAVIVTEGHVNESPLLPKLIRDTVEAGIVLEEVYADKGFLSHANYHAIGSVGATPYISFKKDSHGNSRAVPIKSPFWKTAWHYFQRDPSTFLAHYYKRENVEATFAAIKKRLGETLLSKYYVSQVNELLCKILAHNVTVLIHEAFEHGIPIPGRPVLGDEKVQAKSNANILGPIVDDSASVELEPSRRWPDENN